MTGTPGIGGKPYDTGRLAPGHERWTDKSFSATASRLGVLSKPDYDFTNLGLLFPQNDPSEKIYVNDQMDHRKLIGSALRLHVHFVQTSALLPIFKVDYRYHNNGVAIPGFTTLDTSLETPAFTYPGSGSIIQIIPFPEIPAPAGEDVSANLDMIFYRDDNVVSGDVLMKFLDYHFQMDSDGSRQEFVK